MPCFIFKNSSYQNKLEPGKKEAFKFVHDPLSNFKKISGSIENNLLKKHENSACHKLSIAAQTDFLSQYKNPNNSLEGLSKKISEEKKNEILWSLKLIFSSILYLVKNNLPLRGHRENIEDENTNNGCLIGLIQLIKSIDPVFNKYFDTAPKNATYLSPKIQNEIIDITASIIREKILKELKSSVGYIIHFDETTDRSSISQLCINLRYFYNGEIKECFVDFIDVYQAARKYESNSISGSILSKILLGYLESHQIDPQKCIGICTDTCSMMTSNQVGVFVNMQKTIPHLNHLLCYNHISNLALLDSLNSCDDLKIAIDFIKSLESFFCSAKRDTEFKSFLNDSRFSKLKSLSLTRWSEVFETSNRIILLFTEINKCLHSCAKWSDARTRLNAKTFIGQMENLTLVYSLVVVNYISCHLNPIVKAIQENGACSIEAINKIETLIKVLSSDQSAHINLFEKAKALVESIGGCLLLLFF